MKVKRLNRELRTGIITRLVQHRGFGFITEEDGLSVFFHARAVTDKRGFDGLRMGHEVTFIRRKGYRGHFAVGVKVVDG